MTPEQFLAHWKEQLRKISNGSRLSDGLLNELYEALKADVDKLLDPREGRLIELPGRIPTKKNAKAIAPDGNTGQLKVWYAKEDRQRINDLVQFAALQWRSLPQGRLPAVQHPQLCFEFHVRGSERVRTRYRKDRDNMLTTMLDVLVKAGVLVDDDIAHCNELVSIVPAVVGPAEGARIWIK